MPRFVFDLEQHLGRLFQGGQHLGERRRERRVQDERARSGVVEQIAQLLADVAVVDVERRDAGGVGAEHAFEVLVAVVERERHVVLSGLPPRQLGPLALHGESPAVEVGGEPPGPFGHLGVGEAAVPPHDAFAVGQGLDEGVERLGQVELDGGR